MVVIGLDEAGLGSSSFARHNSGQGGAGYRDDTLLTDVALRPSIVSGAAQPFANRSSVAEEAAPAHRQRILSRS